MGYQGLCHIDALSSLRSIRREKQITNAYFQNRVNKSFSHFLDLGSLSVSCKLRPLGNNKALDRFSSYKKLHHIIIRQKKKSGKRTKDTWRRSKRTPKKFSSHKHKESKVRTNSFFHPFFDIDYLFRIAFLYIPTDRIHSMDIHLFCPYFSTPLVLKVIVYFQMPRD